MKLSDLLQNSLNRKIDRAKVASIKQAIKVSGVIKPLVYTEVMTDKGQENMLTDGHHRYVALKEMGYKDAPAVMADERGIKTAQFQDMKAVRKLVDSIRNLGFIYKQRAARRVVGNPASHGRLLRTQKHGSHDQSSHDPTQGQGGATSSKKPSVRPKSVANKYLQFAESHPNKESGWGGIEGYIDKLGAHIASLGTQRNLNEDREDFLRRRPDIKESIDEDNRAISYLQEKLKTRKFTKHPGHSDQSVHAPGSSKKPSETFGRISSKQVDFIERQVPGVKAYYNSLPANKRPKTATDLITQFEGLQRKPARKVLKGVDALRELLSKLNRLTKEGVSATSVSGLELTREDLQDEMAHPHPGRRKKGWTKPGSFRLSQKMDMDEGVDTKHPYKNPEGANIESARFP